MERLVFVFLLEGVAVCLPMVTYEPLQPLCSGSFSDPEPTGRAVTGRLAANQTLITNGPQRRSAIGPSRRWRLKRPPGGPCMHGEE